MYFIRGLRLRTRFYSIVVLVSRTATLELHSHKIALCILCPTSLEKRFQMRRQRSRAAIVKTIPSVCVMYRADCCGYRPGETPASSRNHIEQLNHEN